MHKPVEDAIGYTRVTDVRATGSLATAPRPNRRSPTRQSESREQITEASVGACQRQIAEQRRRPDMERRVSVVAGFLRQGARDETFPTQVGPRTKRFS
jgi:hypothetical protein